ncbi:LD-carboxypeptidase [Flavobacterium agricola]|uniref:LD-carboxypeptidase n=1 Tax=Flavobacterium agricola TaxID=2870839 RepID=A0ABY6M0X8_9FLAO|nr:LD-carboxypeptidase [Flavobacterium agricola]UYW00868.1 LD-carboxypeptidase [Flavobacterium agricola]
MIIPPYLKKGDTVAIVCTARKFFKEDAQPAIALLESWGLRVKLGKTIGLDYFQLGGTDEQRTADFNEQIQDPEVKAIWVARGGYGTVRIIDLIDFSAFQSDPKWIVGFSDITTLHSHINNLGVATTHAIMPFTVPTAPESVKQTLHDALFGKALTYQIAPHENNVLGEATGELVGGNLSILYSLLGSPSAIQTQNKILFIEDLDEYLYHLDRMMQNLKRNNYFTTCKAIIVGGMTDMHDNQIPYGQNAYEIIGAIAAQYYIPICFDFPAGHVPDNRALIFGQTVNLSIKKDLVTLSF